MTDDKLTRCIVLLETQAGDIAEIKDGIKEQNGRVRKLENDMLRIKTLWTAAVFAAPAAWGYIKAKILGGGA